MSVKFTYDEEKDTLIVKEDNKTNVFKLYKNKYGKLFKYIIKSIDQLDGNEPTPGSRTLSWFMRGESGEESPLISLSAISGATEIDNIYSVVIEGSGEDSKYIIISRDYNSQDKLVTEVYYATFADPDDPWEPTKVEDIDPSKYTISPEVIGEDQETCTFTFTYDGISLSQNEVTIGRTK